MKVEKGQLLRIEHARKGEFVAVAVTDFDTDAVEYWPVAAVEGYVEGSGCGWVPGRPIPCRASMARIVAVLALAEVEGEEEVSGKGL